MTRRAVFVLAASLLVAIVVPCLPVCRVFLAQPLIVPRPETGADISYVLAGGNAMQERLATAADLYHMGWTKKIILFNDDAPGPYCFRIGESWSQVEWQLDYLAWRTVPKKDIIVLDCEKDALFDTLSEARCVANALPDSVQRLMIITSPAHTRRSLLAFQRTLPPEIAVSCYAARDYRYSIEFYHPILLEYLKLLIYWIVA